MTGFLRGQKVKAIHDPEKYGDGYIVRQSEMGDHREVLWMGGNPGNPDSLARQVMVFHVGNMIEVEG
jgi:hypothetical protein